MKNIPILKNNNNNSNNNNNQKKVSYFFCVHPFITSYIRLQRSQRIELIEGMKLRLEKHFFMLTISSSIFFVKILI